MRGQCHWDGVSPVKDKTHIVPLYRRFERKVATGEISRTRLAEFRDTRSGTLIHPNRRTFALGRSTRPGRHRSRYFIISIGPEEVEEFIDNIELIREWADELAELAQLKNPTRSSDPESQKEKTMANWARGKHLKLVSPANNNPPAE